MKIVLTGKSKTGTTGLFYRIRNSLPGTVTCEFEEHDPRAMEACRTDHYLSKLLVDRKGFSLDDYAGFDRKIAIVRDPRDQIVSAALYGPGYHGTYYLDLAKVARMVALLRRKETGDRSVGILDILTLHLRLSDVDRDPQPEAYAAQYRTLMERFGAMSDFFFQKYEDFVADRLGNLEEYLRLSLDGSSLVDPIHARVVRSKGAGSWRLWFSPRDVAFFQPVMQEYIDRFGYDPSWDLPDPEPIPAAHASDYYLRLVTERTMQHKEALARIMKGKDDFVSA